MALYQQMPSLSKKAKELGSIQTSDIFCWIPWHLRIQTATAYSKTGFHRSTSGSDAKSDQKNLQFDKDTDHSRRTDHRQRRCDGCIISQGAIAVHRPTSGMEDVMAAYDETEYLIAYGEQFK